MWIEIKGALPITKRARRYPPFITKRGNLFYANLDVPKDVRHRLRRRYFQSLGTDSLSTAVSRAATLVIRWKSEIKAARQGIAGPLDADVKFWRKILAEDGDWMSRDAALSALHDYAEELERKDQGDTGYGPTNIEESAEIEDRAPGAGIKFYKQVIGDLIGTLEYLDAYLKTTPGLPKTVAGKRTDVVRMAEQFTFTKDVTRKGVRVWCDAMRQDDGLHPHTIARIVSACRKYWRYLELMEVVPENVDPFDKLHLSTKRATKADRDNKRKAFEAVDVVRLHRVAAGDPVLADLIYVAAYTGARIDELCQLRVENVTLDDGDGGHFNIVGSKTEAGDRTTPIHPKLHATLARLCEASVDGWVLPGLKATKYGERSNAIGKRFTTLKRRLGFGPSHVFHSIRKTFVTFLANADVQRDVIMDLVGHERPGLTIGGYHDGATLEIKRAALAKLDYPTSDFAGC